MASINMEQLLNCALCPNMCRCECPVEEVVCREKVSPAGKARLAAMLEQNQLEWDKDMIEVISSCLGCRACQTLCPFSDLILCQELVASVNKAGAAGFSLVESIPYRNNLKKHSSPYGPKLMESFHKSSEAEVIYFAGCTNLANSPEVITATETLLKEAQVSYTMIEEDCCGYPAAIWGDEDLARQMAMETKLKFDGKGASVIITGCPECWYTFNEYYPAWGQTLSQKIIDLPSFLLQLVENKQLVPQQSKQAAVSYHDPCIWTRVAEKTEEPRKLLQSIPGLTISEPYYSGYNTRCCGGGQMMQLSFPLVAETVARQRLLEFPEDIPIVTSCPFCYEGLKAEKQTVIDLAVVMMNACGLKPAVK